MPALSEALSLALSTTTMFLDTSITIPDEAWKDIEMWSTLLIHWNGLSMFYDNAISALDMHLFLDASHTGFGAFFGSQWFSSTWPQEIHSLPPQLKSSPLLELYPIVVTALLWSHLWPRKSIIFFSDNTATEHIINRAILLLYNYAAPLLSHLDLSIRNYLSAFPIIYVCSSAVSPLTNRVGLLPKSLSSPAVPRRSEETIYTFAAYALDSWRPQPAITLPSFFSRISIIRMSREMQMFDTVVNQYYSHDQTQNHTNKME
ncbi:UNVERIFIED_CONTAM: hypothetical protein FKN15_040498 [Acipenser sinensis]